MKKSLLFLFALMLSTLAWADCGFWSDGAGYVSYMSDGVDGMMTCNASGNQPIALGTIESLKLTSFTVKVWKNGDSDITGVTMYYRLGDDDKNIRSVDGTWQKDLESSESTNQEWGAYDLSLAIVDTLADGDYTLHIWFKATTNVTGDDKYLSNGGNNYQFTFTINNSVPKQYYIAGNGKTGGEWCCGQEWVADACPLGADSSITFVNLPVDTYKFKVTNGTWQKFYGYNAMNAKTSTSGYATDKDGNVVFKPKAAGDVTIKFDAINKQITLIVPAGLEYVYMSSVPSQCTDVLMQAFYWDSYAVSEDTPGTDKYGDTRWNTLLGKAGDIGAYFDLIWLPPSAKASGTGYHPKQYSNQSGDWGSRAELQNLIKTLHNSGTKVVADMVINHMDAQGAWCDLSIQNFGEYGIFVPDNSWISCDDEMNDPSTKADTLAGECWGLASGPHEDAPWYDGNNEANYAAARDWAHAKKEVQEMCRAYSKWMRTEIGYDGFRYDYCKGLHASHFDDYNQAGEAYISFLELWASNDAMKQAIQDANYNTMVLDFQSKYSWVDELGKWGNYVGRGRGMMADDNWKKYAVTWIDSHDNFLRGNGGEFGGEDGKSMDPGEKHDRLMQANALMLSMPGIPCVFYPHWYKYSEEIKPMINARHCAGVHNESEVKDEYWDKEGDFNKGYQATILGKNGFIVLQLGTKATKTSWDDNLKLMASGNGYSVWVKADDPVAPRLIVTPDAYFEDTVVGIDVTAKAVGGTQRDVKIYYTTDGTEPTTSSALYTPGDTLHFTQTTVLKVIGVDGTAISKVQTYTYTYREPLERGIVVRFRKPQMWDQVCFYAWQYDGVDSLGNPSSINVMGAYPGKRIYQDKDGWFSYEFASDLDSINFCINSGNECGQLNVRSNDLMADYDVCYGWQDATDTLSNYEILLDCESTVINPDFDVVISPESGYFRNTEEGQEVKINVVGSDNATIYYTKSTDPGKTFQAENEVNFMVYETTTITAYAENDKKEQTPTYMETYTYKAPQSGPLEVKFIKPHDWPDLYLYAFTRVKVGAKFKDTPYALDGVHSKWPGIKWTEFEKIGEDSIYHFTMKPELKEIYVIFNIGSNKTQTQDIFLDENTCFVWNTSCWRAVVSPDCQGETDLKEVLSAANDDKINKFIYKGDLYIRVGDKVYDIFGRVK